MCACVCGTRIHTRSFHRAATQKSKLLKNCGDPLRVCAAAAALDTDSPAYDEGKSKQQASFDEYMELKRFLLKRTQRSAALLTIYVLLALSSRAALCTALGGVASYIYLAWLCQDIDSISPDSDIPMIRAMQIRDPWPRRFARIVAGYQQQIQPRLLVPVFVACGISLYNSQSGDHLSVAEEASVLAGFLSFKLAHVQLLYRDLRPRFEPPQSTRGRPDVSSVEDIQVDMYARSTKQLKAIEEADRVIAEQESKRQNGTR